MAKKKVMKIVSVPTLKEVEVTTCDICGKDVGCMGEIIKTLQYTYNWYSENIKGGE